MTGRPAERSTHVRGRKEFTWPETVMQQGFGQGTRAGSFVDF
jgi:hypothetical protein